MSSNLICIAICRMVEMHVGYKQRSIKILYYVFVIVVAMGVMYRMVYYMGTVSRSRCNTEPRRGSRFDSYLYHKDRSLKY